MYLKKQIKYFGKKLLSYFHKKHTHLPFISYICSENPKEITIMANKRKLKKIINYICNDLFSECVAASLYGKKEKNEEISAILSSILIMRNNYICRISHPEPGMSPKTYFKDLKEKLNVHITEIIDNIANI